MLNKKIKYLHLLWVLPLIYVMFALRVTIRTVTNPFGLFFLAVCLHWLSYMVKLPPVVAGVRTGIIVASLIPILAAHLKYLLHSGLILFILLGIPTLILISVATITLTYFGVNYDSNLELQAFAVTVVILTLLFEIFNAQDSARKTFKKFECLIYKGTLYTVNLIQPVIPKKFRPEKKDKSCFKRLKELRKHCNFKES